MKGYIVAVVIFLLMGLVSYNLYQAKEAAEKDLSDAIAAIDSKDKALDEMRLDQNARETANKKLREDLADLETAKRLLAEQIDDLRRNTPSISDKVVVIDDRKMVDVKVVDDKMSEYYNLIYSKVVVSK